MTDRATFDPDGRAIPFVHEGDDGPTLILLPETGQDITSLGTLAGVLAEEGFSVTRVGSRQTADGSTATLHERAHDVVDVMDHLGIADAWIGGHSTGGDVARTVSLDDADRVNGVLLLGVTASATDDAALAPSIPVLVIQGSDDDVTPPTHGERLLANAPDRVTVVAIEGGGHLFAATHAGETAAVIEDYLDWD